MSFGIAILLSERKLPTKSYLSFVNACTSIFGEWDIYEVSPFNLNDDDVHDFAIVTATAKRTHTKRVEQVWVSLQRREFMKKYGRGRRKINWQIYLETKAGRGPEGLAQQLLMPLQAFSFFTDPVVLVEFTPEKIFLERTNYEAFAKHEISSACGEDFLNSLDLKVPPDRS